MPASTLTAWRQRLQLRRSGQLGLVTARPMVTVEEIHSPDQLAGFFGMPSNGDFGSDAPRTVRVIVSASGKTYADGEHIPITDQQIIESFAADRRKFGVVS